MEAAGTLTRDEAVKRLEAGGSRIHLTSMPGRLSLEPPVSLRGVALGGTCRVGQYSYIGQGGELRDVSIGRFCSLARRLAVGLAEHPVDRLSSHPFAFGNATGFGEDPYLAGLVAPKSARPADRGRTEIGHDVWLGNGVFVRRGVSIGTGCVVAAGAVVTADLPPYVIAGGVPARVIRPRFAAGIADRLLASRWWDRDLSVLGPLDWRDVAGCLDRIEAGDPPERPVTAELLRAVPGGRWVLEPDPEGNAR